MHHLLERQGDPIGALALVTIDNPMCPGTGHRICNDCMKACIYQKQEPVNIPQIETGVLTDVLALPWGFEIYGLLTRWNPLNVQRPYALPYNGKNVLVVGLGPAGYTLAHYLLNEGFGVVGIDGLKIEPLPGSWSGDPSRDVPPRPVRDFDAIYRRPRRAHPRRLRRRVRVRHHRALGQELPHAAVPHARAPRQLPRLRRRALRRHARPLDDAWELGFDHVAIAAGAGKPTIIDMKNNLIRGIRKASDFLMALQLTGAYKKDALANLQVRLPAVVIGGGLTAIDTATELLAYYRVQVEKTLERYEALAAAESARRRCARCFDAEEREILDELLEHGRAIRDERARAAAAGERPTSCRCPRVGRRHAGLPQAA